MIRIVTILVLGLFISTQANAAKKAADFSLKTDSGKVTLSKLNNKLVYVDFWATWCTPCRKSFPWMNEMKKKYEKKGLKIIAISLDDDPSRVKKFVKKFPADFTIAYDPEGTTADSYDVKVMPSSYLIGKNRKLISTHYGFKNKDKDKLEAEFRKALGL